MLLPLLLWPILLPAAAAAAGARQAGSQDDDPSLGLGTDDETIDTLTKAAEAAAQNFEVSHGGYAWRQRPVPNPLVPRAQK